MTLDLPILHNSRSGPLPEYKAARKKESVHSGIKEINFVREISMAEEYPHYADDAKFDLYFELPSLLPYFQHIPLPTSDENKTFVNHGETKSTIEYEQRPNKSLNDNLGAIVNVMPKSVFENLKLPDLKKSNMLVELAGMTKKTPLETGDETMILGRPFLAIIHAKIDFFLSGRLL
nr:hypothetical protein [Tanacetum cinerariifolium]